MNPTYTDRELSWLQFNLRVLKQAEDNNLPLLERLNFLNIYRSNLDEFFMVRVGSITHKKIFMPDYKDVKTGWTPDVQLKKIFKEVNLLQKEEEQIANKLMKDFENEGIQLVDYDKMNKLDESIAKKIYAEVKDYLTYRIIDSKHALNFLNNNESYVANYVQKNDKKYVGIISLYRIPKYRVFETDSCKKVFLLPQLVAHYSKNLYKKYTVKESCIIRVTRNADVVAVESLNSYASDIKQDMEAMLHKRKHQQPVRLQISGKISAAFAEQINFYLGISKNRIFKTSVPLDLDFKDELGSLPQLKYTSRKISRGINVKRGDLISYLEKKDILLSFPYQSMDSFVDLLYEAADNVNVKSIKITLYRLSYSSKVAMALAYAADKGKDVLCLLELRARFDEKNNIDYSEMLTQAGCKVIYGLPDMKVHAKLCLITMQNGKQLSYITQIGTGNYNEKTSTLYCDLSLITKDLDIAEDAKLIFAALEAGIAPQRTEHLMCAPNGYKQRLIELLEEECSKGENGSVVIKVNSMNDTDIMQELVKCSKAGVKVELFIRGICCLVPGIEGETDNITVKSIVGRYLEHSRILVLGKGSKARIFIGSGDLLNRNTTHRVEVMAEVKQADLRKKVLYIIDAFRNDSENSWIMNSDGKYSKPELVKGSYSQDILYKYFAK